MSSHMGLSAATKRARQPVGESRQQCPICESPHLEYEFVVEKSPVCGCQDCGLLFLNPQPARTFPVDDETSQLQSKVLVDLYRANAVERMQQLTSYARLRGGKLLLVGADGYLATEARSLGFEAFAVSPEEFESLPDSALPRGMAACVLFCALERMREPLSILRKVKSLLAPGASLMVVSPTVDSQAARWFRNSWWEFNRTNLYYFSVDSLQNLLIKAGFGDPVIAPDRSLVSLNYLRQKLRENTRALRHYRWLRRATSATPLLRNKTFRLFYSRTRFLVRAKENLTRPVLSVIVPVFNEKNTCTELLDQ
ncbi:MAG: class I SAM-dependent methyltransferase, partial [Acidobacteriaceae bacterium]|nr:class I SAM-dependent methyltransferase [Acidobacteriaceae bacterium]